MREKDEGTSKEGTDGGKRSSHNKVWKRSGKGLSVSSKQRSSISNVSQLHHKGSRGPGSNNSPSIGKPFAVHSNSNTVSLEIIPDEALVNILGRISDGRMLARCAGVCRRWRRLCRQVPVLKLVIRKMQAWQAEGVISAALLERKGLRDFEVRFVCPRKYASEGVRESRVFGCLWRLSSSIETLALMCPNTVYFKLWTWLAKFPQLSTLKIHCGRIEENPLSGSLEWLKKCEFSRTIISETMLEDLVKYSPVLEEMVVVGCDPIESLSLESESLRHLNLVATEEYPMKSLELRTRNLRHLYICHVEQLQADAPELTNMGIYSACETHISSLHNVVSLEMDGKGWALESIEHVVCAAQGVSHLVLKASISEVKPLRIEHYLSPMFCLQTLILDTNLLECFCRGLSETQYDAESPVFALRKVAVKVSDENKDGMGSLLTSLASYCPDLGLLILDTSEIDGEVPPQLLGLKELEPVKVILYNDPKDQSLLKELNTSTRPDTVQIC